MIAADALLSTVEEQASITGRSTHSYGKYYLKVRYNGEAFSYSTSLGHVYGSRDEALEDIDACIGQQVTGCQNCKRVLPCKDHRSAYCLECTAKFTAETTRPLLVTAGVPAGFRRDVKADWL